MCIPGLFRAFWPHPERAKQPRGGGIQGRQSAAPSGAARGGPSLGCRDSTRKRPLGATVAWRGHAMALRPLLLTLGLWAVAGSLSAGKALADGVVPPATELPSTLALDDALRIFHSRGLDLLIA